MLYMIRVKQPVGKTHLFWAIYRGGCGVDVAGTTSDTVDDSEILHQLRSVVYATVY